MEQSDADRAAVAREVLTELEVWLDNGDRPTVAAGVIREFKTQRYPAPAPPETVTVTVGGRVWAREVDGWWVHHSDTSHDVCGPKSTIGEMCARIASDARVIRELERSRDGWDADARREAGNVLYWRGERDRAIEAIKERDARIAELETQLQRALDGAVFHEKRAHHAEQERDAALRALEEAKGEAGATVAASEPLASESPAATSPSPDPVPLGATIEVDGVKWARTELGWSGGAWRYRDSSTVARVLTALYRARHPVATRETVERVAEALFLSSEQSKFQRETTLVVRHWHDLARAALTAAGFTLEEGA